MEGAIRQTYFTGFRGYCQQIDRESRVLFSMSGGCFSLLGSGAPPRYIPGLRESPIAPVSATPCVNPPSILPDVRQPPEEGRGNALGHGNASCLALLRRKSRRGKCWGLPPPSGLFILIATIKIVDTHLDGSFPSCLCPKNLKAIKASCVFGASAAEKAPRPAVCRQF